MRRVSIVIVLIALFGTGLLLGQTDHLPDIDFTLEQTIGLALPRRVLYDPNFERYVVQDAYGSLNFVDAHTYAVQHVLHSRGSYNDFAFSHDGRWFVLAIDTRLELWDTQTYEIVTELTNINEAISVQGPMAFSPDDTFLLFTTTQPAPQAIRRSEFDTQDISWIWNLVSARNEGDSNFPAGVEAYPFFDYRNGFVIGPDNRAVAALPGRLHILDVVSLDVLFDIETFRYEPDPLNVLFSARDNNIYVRTVNEPALLQVDTQRGLLVEIPLRKNLTRDDLELIGGIELGTSAQVIGEVSSRATIPLLQRFISEDYRDPNRHGNAPLTVTLVDLVVPPTGDGDRTQALLFIFNENRNTGYFQLFRPQRTQQMTLSPDGTSLLIRDDDEVVEIYDIASGAQKLSVTPALRGAGYYSWQEKNRVLAYTADGTEFISDFERFTTDTGESVAQDLRYSQQFDKFFWKSDSHSLVTLSGTEWRLFDLATGKVVQREALPLQGSIVDTSTDGYRYLTTIPDGPNDNIVGRAIFDLTNRDARSVTFQNLPARNYANIIASPDWEHFLVVYEANQWGPYYPGNEVMLYGLDEGAMWFMAGDDLPYPDRRQYGWVDNETVYITGQIGRMNQPQRVYGLEFAPSGVPTCLTAQAQTASDIQEQMLAWEALTRRMSSDNLASLTQALCAQENVSLDDLQPTLTPIYLTPTPIVVAGVPPCLTVSNSARANELSQVWQELTTGMSADEIASAEALLCEGIAPTATPVPSAVYRPPSTPRPQSDIQTMFINAVTGERATGDYRPPASTAIPLDYLISEFRDNIGYDPGLVVLSPDEQLIASSSRPGELIIYRLLTRYDEVLNDMTATANAQLATQQLIAVMPTATPTYDAVGTARPTLTPTVTPTSPPLPEDTYTNLPQAGEVQAFCPAETLYLPDNLPASYQASGRILVNAGQRDQYWVVEPQSGQRYPEEDVPPCDSQLNCQFSPDRRWILASGSREIFLIRPDGTDRRILFEQNEEWPANIGWGGVDLLVSEQTLQIPDAAEGVRAQYIVRDNITTEDDPPPWRPIVKINGESAEIVSTAYNVGYVLVRTTFSTGLSPGYRYYIHNIETGWTNYFARIALYPESSLYAQWVTDAQGTRLFYSFPDEITKTDYVFDPADQTHRIVTEKRFGGTLSPNQRYRVFGRNLDRAQPIGVWDTLTGLQRSYCIPENGARLYEGSFAWSPDSRYIALQTTLPKDESQPGIGAHTLILDTETGVMVDLTTGVGTVLAWMEGNAE